MMRNKNSDGKILDSENMAKTDGSIEEEFKINYGFFKKDQQPTLEKNDQTISINSIILPSQKDRKFEIQNDYIDKEFNNESSNMTELQEVEATKAAYAALDEDVS